MWTRGPICLGAYGLDGVLGANHFGKPSGGKGSQKALTRSTKEGVEYVLFDKYYHEAWIWGMVGRRSKLGYSVFDFLIFVKGLVDSFFSGRFFQGGIVLGFVLAGWFLVRGIDFDIVLMIDRRFPGWYRLGRIGRSQF